MFSEVASYSKEFKLSICTYLMCCYCVFPENSAKSDRDHRCCMLLILTYAFNGKSVFFLNSTQYLFHTLFLYGVGFLDQQVS